MAAKDVSGTVFQLPILGMFYQLPADGLPHFWQWYNTASDLFHMGYESNREPMEVRKRDVGTHMAKVQPVKGLGRCSIIYFGVLFTYLEMRNDLSPEELADFRRPLQGLSGA